MGQIIQENGMGFRKALWSMEKGRVGLTGSSENIVKNAIMNLQWFTFVSLYGGFFSSLTVLSSLGVGMKKVKAGKTLQLEFSQAEIINIRQRG